jgi:hypothetical protein
VVEGYPWWLRPFVMKGVVAITLGRRIYVTPNSNRAQKAIERLLWHELTHVRQVRKHGLFVFLVRYVSEFVRLFLRERSVTRAYRGISFEVEAWAAESRADV